MKYHYKNRKSSDFKLITQQDTKNKTTTELVKQEYPYIYQAMKKENYKIEYDDFEIIQEIIDEDKVVGIIAMINQDALDQTLCINEIYILPEHRNKGLFYQNLLNLLSQPNMTVALRNPSRRIIDLLIEYKFAQKLDNNLVVSYVDFYVDYSKHYTNKKIKEYYNEFQKNYQKEFIRTEYYDLNINSSIFFDIDNILVFNKNPAYIETARLCDSKKENYYQKINNVDMVYINVLLESLNTIDDNIIKFYEENIQRINKYLKVDNILGTKDELTPLFIELLHKNDLTTDDGYKIRKQVINALKRNEIIPKSIVLRTVYLIEHYPQEDVIIDKNLELGRDLEEECPYCNTNNYSVLEVCRECGYNLQRNNHFEENFPEIISENFFLHQIIPECTIKEEINNKQEKLHDYVPDELFYDEFDKEVVYETQTKMATYQLLKEIEDLVYFDIFDYDGLNSIREGSAFDYAKKNHLIKELKDYRLYFEIMDVCFPIKELKNILENNNQNIDGSREELLERIKRELSPIDIFGKKYEITKEGTDFLKNHQAYDYFIDNIRQFLFYEFVEFTKHYSGKLIELADSFIDYMEEISIEYNDIRKYHKVVVNKLNNIQKESDEYLVLFTQLFIMDINYWISMKEHAHGEKPLSIDVSLEYPEIKQLFLKKNINEIFSQAFDKIEIEDLKKYEDLSLCYLIKSLKYEDIEDLNREIENDKYNYEYVKSLIKE